MVILSIMSSFQQNMMRHTKKQQSVIHTQEKRHSIDTVSQCPQLLGLANQAFKEIINIYMFKELNETISKE